MDLRGKRVLVFGDSLTHRSPDSGPIAYDVTEGVNRDSSPGDLLASQLLALGARGARINGKVSRSAWNFFRVEDGAGILVDEANRDPDVVFVFLGTNDLGLDPTKDAEAFNQIRSAFINVGADVYAIGPPAFASATSTTQAQTVYATLRSVFGDARVIDSRPYTGDVARTSDGVHFPASSARIVAARLAQVINNMSGPATALVPSSFLAPIGLSIGVSVVFVGLAWMIRRRRHLAH